MSQYYEVHGTTVWNPALGTSRQFLRFVRVFEIEVGVPSGIGPAEPNDISEIDPEVFGAFVNELVRWYLVRTGSPDADLLSRGFIVIVLALAQRAGVMVDWPPTRSQWDADKLNSLREQAQEKERQMVR
ncbi:MAG TPA: DUF6086 family protein [Pseudonocardiaceae bacterium]|nr:DUF6086 family protein [Pseudonocardiaceae bacterium]